MKIVLLGVAAVLTFAVSAMEGNTEPLASVDMVQTIASRAGNDTGV